MALPFDLPSVSRGFASMTPAARGAGARAAAAACASLGRLLGGDVAVTARAVPAVPAARSAAVRLGVELPALPGTAVLEAEAALVVALVDGLAGGHARGPVGCAATALTPVEAAAFELLALFALDGICAAPGFEDRLAPRLSRRPVEPPGALAIELELSAPGASGRGRLLLPPAALGALSGDAAPGPARALRIPVSIRSGRAALSPAELAALAVGDVLLLDPPGAGEGALVLPGGARLGGRLAPDGFHVEEAPMTDRNALVPIILEIELARVEIPLGELARLEPGAVLPLGLDRRGLVTLRLGDRAVGRGELVDVDGNVGVRVHALEVAP